MFVCLRLLNLQVGHLQQGTMTFATTPSGSTAGPNAKSETRILSSCFEQAQSQDVHGATDPSSHTCDSHASALHDRRQCSHPCFACGPQTVCWLWRATGQRPEIRVLLICPAAKELDHESETAEERRINCVFGIRGQDA